MSNLALTAPQVLLCEKKGYNRNFVRNPSGHTGPSSAAKYLSKLSKVKLCRLMSLSLIRTFASSLHLIETIWKVSSQSP